MMLRSSSSSTNLSMQPLQQSGSSSSIGANGQPSRLRRASALLHRLVAPRTLYIMLIALPLLTLALLARKQWDAGDAGGGHCVGWKATDGCHWRGKRIPERDRKCSALVSGVAGYCLCSGNVTVARVGCGTHHFHCAKKCRMVADDPSIGLRLPEPLTCGPQDTYFLERFIPGSAAGQSQQADAGSRQLIQSQANATASTDSMAAAAVAAAPTADASTNTAANAGAGALSGAAAGAVAGADAANASAVVAGDLMSAAPSTASATSRTETSQPVMFASLANQNVDVDALSARSRQWWDGIDILLGQHGPPDVKLPGVRISSRDWVLEGRHMHKPDVQALTTSASAFRAALPPFPGTETFQGRGIVTVGGGLPYFTPAWVSVHMLRATGCNLPMEMFFPVAEFPTSEVEAVLAALGVTCRRLDQRDLDQSGYTIKVAALLLSRFQEVLFLDADNFALRDPTFLFSSPAYASTGALLWPDFWTATAAPEVLTILNISRASAPRGTFESGQMLVDKARHWHGLLMALYINAYAHTYYELLTGYLGKGDKETFTYGMLAANETYTLIQTPPGAAGSSYHRCKPHSRQCSNVWTGNTMLQHGPDGRILFLHSNYEKFSVRIPQRFEDMARRWVQMQPGNVDMLNWFSEQGYGDPEQRVYDLLRAFACAPWYSSFYRQRLRMGDKPVPPLDGFSTIIDGMDFRRVWRQGWIGNFAPLFEPTWSDNLHAWYRRGLYWRLKRLRRGLRGKLRKFLG